ncbi:hypothetical protein H0H81_007320 [Sphagnurus paluster]|uniref:F-box domain-containing protein n=1 Tax=Sphagnurus paluster TaxID=117069 RepID=A0A9P7FUW3_9AGAR|nr:hypothetical protein H0H81_007320 [Sphagnurus paluster]
MAPKLILFSAAHTRYIKTRPPRLPNELIRMILCSVGDLPFLWVECRAVSKSFNTIVHEIFFHRHLRRTSLRINAGRLIQSFHIDLLTTRAPRKGKWFRGPPGSAPYHLDAVFRFEKLDPRNPWRAIFVDPVCAIPKTVSRIKKMFQYGPQAHSPAILIQIRRMVNDTAVPGLVLNLERLERLELSCDWRGMYSAFFREEREFNRRWNSWTDSPQMQFMAHQMAKRIGCQELTAAQGHKELYKQSVVAAPDFRKILRRARIAREVRENHGILRWKWKGDEDDEALLNLEGERFTSRVEGPFSDDEDDDKISESESDRD